MFTGGNFILTLVHLGFQPSSTKKGYNDEYQTRENEQKPQGPLFFPDFNVDVAIIKDKKTFFGWVADPLFSIPRQLLVFINAIENLPEVSVPYE